MKRLNWPRLESACFVYTLTFQRVFEISRMLSLEAWLSLCGQSKLATYDFKEQRSEWLTDLSKVME